MKDAPHDALYIDSRVPKHMTGKLEWFKHLWEVTGQTVTLGDDTMLKVEGINQVSIITPNREKGTNIDDVVYVPSLKANLISVA